MNYDKNDWKISLERIDTNKGYIKSNVVLCCQEFNGCCQWSIEKIKEIKKILVLNIQNNPQNFDLIKNKSKIPIKVAEKIENNITYFSCNYCKGFKTRENYGKYINQGCKICRSKIEKERNSTPRNSLKILLTSAKKHTKLRMFTSIDKRDNSFDIDFEYLKELFEKQKGLCAYSNLPLNFCSSYLEKNWRCSLKRIDVSKGYVKDNVCLICLEFNTGNRSILYGDDDIGNSGWNKDKFDIFYKSII